MVVHTTCMQKINANAGEQDNFSFAQIQSDDPVENEFSKINSAYFTLLKTIREDKEKGIQDNGNLKYQLLTNVEDFKNFIKKNPQSSQASVALTTAANIFNLFEDNDGRKSFLDEILNDKELSSLKGTAENLMIDYYSNIKDFDRAIITADAFITNYKSDEELLCEGLLKKGLILAHQMQQPDKAIECFADIVNNHPNNQITEFAKNELKALGKDSEIIKKGSLTTESLGFSTSSYPNPFNPTTIINYTLPENERVVIKVYDIIGREVKELVNEQKAAGTYSVEFDGSKLSSGVYFYTITAGKYSQTKKMVLTK